MRQELAKTFEFQGKRSAAKRIIARSVVEAIVTGKWKLADGTFSVLSHTEIIDLVKWVYERVDGKPPAEHDVNLSGRVSLQWDWEPTKSE